MYDGHWFGGGFMWIFWILLILAIIWGIKAVSFGGTTSSNRQKSALDILKERYARGEIEQQEFDQKRKDLADKM